MFKDIKAFLSSFIQKAKDRNIFKKYLGITLAGVLTILIPIIIAVLYIQFNDKPITETQVEELTITIFDNDGHTINSDTVSLDKIETSPFINLINNVINTKSISVKPENFNKSPTFNITVASIDTSLTYKCYFEKDASNSFIEDNTGNFFLPSKNEYSTFLNSEFSQQIYFESVPPSLTVGKDSFVLPYTVDWSYTLTNGSVQKSSNYKATTETKSYMIDGAIDFMFSEIPSTCNIKIKTKDGKLFFDGTLEETADFTANDGDKFTIIVDATWTEEQEKTSFGSQHYEFDIICTKPSNIELTPQKAVGGSIVKISISDVNNADTIVYTAKEPQSKSLALQTLYEFTPTFIKDGQNAYAYLPIPNDIEEEIFEFSVSYGIAKVDFSLSLAKRSVSSNIPLSSDDISFNITDKEKNEFSKLIANGSTTYGNIILFTSEFLSPEEYGFKKSIEYNSEISIDDNISFNFLANAYTSSNDEHIAVKSANIGIVRAVGYSELLGNYVAIDHGAGLYTWYFGLSDISISKGDILKKGAFIGRSGSSFPLCSNGVNIFCTLYGNLIDPDDILGNKLV